MDIGSLDGLLRDAKLLGWNLDDDIKATKELIESLQPKPLPIVLSGLAESPKSVEIKPEPKSPLKRALETIPEDCMTSIPQTNACMATHNTTSNTVCSMDLEESTDPSPHNLPPNKNTAKASHSEKHNTNNGKGVLTRSNARRGPAPS